MPSRPQVATDYDRAPGRVPASARASLARCRACFGLICHALTEAAIEAPPSTRLKRSPSTRRWVESTTQNANTRSRLSTMARNDAAAADTLAMDPVTCQRHAMSGRSSITSNRTRASTNSPTAFATSSRRARRAFKISPATKVPAAAIAGRPAARRATTVGSTTTRYRLRRRAELLPADAGTAARPSSI